jgi:hypothetical protein
MGHHQFSPSSFPALDICPHYRGSEEESKNANYGTVQHELLECLMNEQYDKFESIDADVNQRANAEWTYSVVQNFIQKEKMNLRTVEVLSERQVATETTDMTYITGTADVIIVSKVDDKPVKLILLDAKFGKMRNYLGQLYVYALGIMQEFGLDECEAWCIYGQLRKSEEHLIYKDNAVKYVDDVLDRVKHKHLEEKKAGDGCEFCANKSTCSAILAPMKEIKEALPAEVKCLGGLNLATSSIATMPSLHLGKIMDLYDYMESIKTLAEEEMMKRMDNGEIITGWKINERAGATKIADQQALMFELKTLRGITDAEIVEKSNLTVTAVKELIYGDDAKKKPTGDKFKDEFADFLKTESASRKVARIKNK